MKRKLTLRFGMLLFATFLLSSLNSLSASERTRNCSAPLYLTIPNNGIIVKGSQVVVHVQLEKSESVSTIEVIAASGVTPTEVRTNFQKDGKVDVDIIIRGENFLPFLYPYASGPTAHIRIATISYITVDNISGVFEANNSNPSLDVSSRLIEMSVDNGIPQLGSNGNGTNNEASISMGTVSVNSISSSITVDETKAIVADNITLYPNPIRDNVLNLSFSQGSTSIQGVRVFNALGAIVYQDLSKQLITGTYTVQLPILPAGIYFVRVSLDSNEVVKKFNLSK